MKNIFNKLFTQKFSMEEKLAVEYVVTQVCNWMFDKYRINVSPQSYIKIQNILIEEMRNK